MKIKDKEKLKIEIKETINKYTKEFPSYFFINIILNGILLLAVVLILIIIINFNFILGGFLVVLFLCIATLLSIMSVTIKNFLINIKILHQIQKGDYEFGVHDHEMDNIVELIEDLPLEVKKVKKMRKTLSFNKIFNVLEAVDILKKKKGFWDVDLEFRYKAKSLEGDYFEVFLKKSKKK